MSKYNIENEKKQIIKLRSLIDKLPQFSKSFFRSIEPRTTIKTRIAYAYDLSVFFTFLKNNNSIFKSNINLDDLDKITPVDIEEFLEYLKFYQNGENLTKMNTNLGIKRKLSTLKSFYNYYYKNSFIKSNPALLVSMPKIRDKEIIRLEKNEVNDLLSVIENGNGLTEREKKFHHITLKRDLAMISLLLTTGIRISECIGINLEDIDFNTNAIRITRKGGKSVFIYFSDEIEKTLKDYIIERNNKLSDNKIEENALFLSLQYKRLSVRAAEKLVKKYASIATPLKHITPHKLRSTYGTNLYKETGDIYLVADVLGHSDVNTTKKHYAAIEEDRRKSARNIVKLKE